MDVYSFFTGAGFLDLGFEDSGFTIVFANEVHEPFFAGYEHSRSILDISLPDKCEVSSIKEVAKSRLLKKGRDSLVGFIGGPPCPDFSIAGKQKGASGSKGALSKTYVDMIIREKPDWFLFENVKGLWRTKKHRAFYDELCKTLIKSGYCLTNRLINALEYGVPQERERIILLGFKKTIAQEKAGWINEKFPWEARQVFQMEDILEMPWPGQSTFGSTPQRPRDCSQQLMVETWFNTNRVQTHPNATHCFKPRAGLARFQSVNEGDDSKKSYKRLHRWRYSPTAAYGNNEVHLHPYEARRISVAEALAIQSMPEQFEFPAEMTLTNMFKTIGNGVPYLASKGLASSIRDYIESKV